MNCSTPGLPVHHQLPEFTQTHVHQVGDAIQPSHPLDISLSKFRETVKDGEARHAAVHGVTKIWMRLNMNVSGEMRCRRFQGPALIQPAFQFGAAAESSRASPAGVFSPAWTAGRHHRSLPSTATGLSAQGQWICLNSKGLWPQPIPSWPLSNLPPIPSSTLSYHTPWASSVFQSKRDLLLLLSHFSPVWLCETP